MTNDRDDNGLDRTAELLTQALHEEAASVSPESSALQRIQARTGSSGPPRSSESTRRSWLYAGLGAAAATAVVITGVTVLGDHGSQHAGPAVGPSSVPTTGPVTPTQSGSTQGGAKIAVPPLSYVGKATHRLFAETHPGFAPGDPLTAMAAMLRTPPFDPDYTSGWPAGVRVHSQALTGSSTRVDLTGSAGTRLAADPALGPHGGMLAVQSLLSRDDLQPGDTATFTFNGSPVQTILGVRLPVRVQSPDATRALVAITNVRDGQALSNPVSVTVSGNTFEANVNWQLLDRSGAKVDEGSVTTPGGMGTWSEATIDLGTLDPGTYTIRCLEYSPRDGRPGNVDDKTFTVS